MEADALAPLVVGALTVASVPTPATRCFASSKGVGDRLGALAATFASCISVTFER